MAKTTASKKIAKVESESDSESTIESVDSSVSSESTDSESESESAPAPEKTKKTTKKSDEKSEEKIQCKFVLTTGKNKGNQCSKNAKYEDVEYCGIHLGKEDTGTTFSGRKLTEDEIKKESESEVESVATKLAKFLAEKYIDLEEDGLELNELVKDIEKFLDVPVAKPTENKKSTKKSEEKSTEKSTEKSQCQFVLTRGDRKGQKCGKGCKSEYCSVHAKSSKGREADSKGSAKGSESKSENDDVPKPKAIEKVKIVREKELGLWLVEGTTIVVKSPKNRAVVGYVNKKREVTEKLTPALKKKATELGLLGDSESE